MSASVAVLCQLLWGDAAVERRARLEIQSLLDAGFGVPILTQQPVVGRASERWPAIVELEPTVAPPAKVFARHTSTKLLAFTLAAGRFARSHFRGDLVAAISHSPAGIVGWLGASAIGLIGTATRLSLNLTISLFGMFYLTAVILLHRGCEPLWRFAELLRDMVPSTRVHPEQPAVLAARHAEHLAGPAPANGV